MGSSGSGDIPGAGVRPGTATWERQAPISTPPRGQRSPLPCPCLGHPEPGQAFRKESRLLFKIKVTRPLLPSSPTEHLRFTSSSYTCSGASVTLQLCKSPPQSLSLFFCLFWPHRSQARERTCAPTVDTRASTPPSPQSLFHEEVLTVSRN